MTAKKHIVLYVNVKIVEIKNFTEWRECYNETGFSSVNLDDI